MECLDVDHSSTAYHCGRLLALLETIQRKSSEDKINTTLTDKFYGSASSAPGSVFGWLMTSAQSHLSKLRKNHPGAHRNFETELEEVSCKLGVFPDVLNLQEQGLFALGFYHQKAEYRRTMIAARAKNQPVSGSGEK